MASLLEQALNTVGLQGNANDAIGAALSLTQALDIFQNDQNGNPPTGAIGVLKDLIDANIPPILKFPETGGINFKAKEGAWESLHYADDLVARHPKMKFLFKVSFNGFTENTCYYFVHTCDKPSVNLVHADANYYNFRTKILTHVIFNPINLTILDEIGNSLNEFFTLYMTKISGQANGQWGVNKGFTGASSSNSYTNGYSLIKSMSIMQIFGNGTQMNEFKLINPRIETFAFDGLSMEENGMSMANLTINYDSLQCKTVSLQDESIENSFYTWGQTDLLRGGGTSGVANNGATSLGENPVKPSGADGRVATSLGSRLSSQAIVQSLGDAIQEGAAKVVPAWLRSTVKGGVASIQSSLKDLVSSSTTATSRDVAQSVASMQSTPKVGTVQVIQSGGN